NGRMNGFLPLPLRFKFRGVGMDRRPPASAKLRQENFATRAPASREPTQLLCQGILRDTRKISFSTLRTRHPLLDRTLLRDTRARRSRATRGDSSGNMEDNCHAAAIKYRAQAAKEKMGVWGHN